MKRSMIFTAALLLMMGSAARAVEPGSIFDSPANWTAKAWTAACFVCELDRQPQADICRPDFTNTIFSGPFGTKRYDSPEQRASLLTRCIACAARQCMIDEDKAKRSDFYARPDFYYSK